MSQTPTGAFSADTHAALAFVGTNCLDRLLRCEAEPRAKGASIPPLTMSTRAIHEPEDNTRHEGPSSRKLKFWKWDKKDANEPAPKPAKVLMHWTIPVRIPAAGLSLLAWAVNCGTFHWPSADAIALRDHRRGRVSHSQLGSRGLRQRPTQSKHRQRRARRLLEAPSEQIYQLLIWKNPGSCSAQRHGVSWRIQQLIAPTRLKTAATKRHHHDTLSSIRQIRFMYLIKEDTNVT